MAGNQAWVQAPLAALGRGLRVDSFSSRPAPWRTRGMVWFFGVLLGALLARSAQIQIVNADFYLKQGEARYLRALEQEAVRGRILDRNGEILAMSAPAVSLWASPELSEQDPSRLRQLARVLGLSELELAARLAPKANFVWLRRHADDALVEAAMALKLPGLLRTEEYKRVYPSGAVAGPVLGLTNLDQRGQEGIELVFEQSLRGQAGRRLVSADRLGRAVEEAAAGASVQYGQDLFLSLDSVVQYHAFSALRDLVEQSGAKSASLVALDARSAEVLAMASYPSQDPQQRREFSPDHMRNKSVTDLFQPGGLVQPLLAALMLDAGRVGAESILRAEFRSFGFEGLTFTRPPSLDSPTLAQALASACDICVAQLALELQPRELFDFYTRLGFGRKPVIEFPGAVAGWVAPVKNWGPQGQAKLALGYGLNTSLLQLARAYLVLTADGQAVEATLRKNPQAVQPLPVVSASVAARVREMMGDAPRRGEASTPNYPLIGRGAIESKLGQAGYSKSKYRALFLGMAPADQPRLIIALLLDEAQLPQSQSLWSLARLSEGLADRTLWRLGVVPSGPRSPGPAGPGPGESRPRQSRVGAGRP
ncbi:cell division protein FtsI (penicillin-binding protein 3) [Paucibacter oligotrophus]|uniref:Cell division protein FtsI (Penicillin-binding protein 3) n=1 Tax=Roseateles oligotrophus TaxID=1769250 RepID=A0A840LAZ6_9BURK|nr:cell division protein FtsI (penicillin-binding protein 3) [Roseateles oligotrophus]